MFYTLPISSESLGLAEESQAIFTFLLMASEAMPHPGYTMANLCQSCDPVTLARVHFQRQGQSPQLWFMAMVIIGLCFHGSSSTPPSNN